MLILVAPVPVWSNTLGGLGAIALSPWSLCRTSTRYVLTNQWTVATRHPDALREALTKVGVPVTPPDASGLTPASP